MRRFVGEMPGECLGYEKIYTTSIIYKLKFLCYDVDVVKRKAGRQCSGKEKDMTAMNRFSKLYNECCLCAHLAERKLGLCVMRSSVDNHKRGNCVLDVELQ